MTDPTAAAAAQAKRDAMRAKYAEQGALTSGTVADEPAPIIPFSASLEGLEGTGKSTFLMLTTPYPRVAVNFGDRSLVPFLYQIPKERRQDVQVYDIKAPSSDGWDFKSAVDGLRQLAEIVAAEAPYMQNGTFGLDGGTSWWSVMQQVFVEPKEKAREAAGKKQVGGIIYEEANGRARGFMDFLRHTDAFFFMTHQLRQDWAADGPIPNQYSARRNSQVQYLMDCVVRFMKVCAVCSAPNCQNKDHVGRKHFARLEQVKGNTGFEGLWIENLTFSKLYKFQTGHDFTGAV